MDNMDLSYYRLQPYNRRSSYISKDVDGSSYWVAWIRELDGCMACGETQVDAMNNLQKAFDANIMAMLEWGQRIPDPGEDGIAYTPPIKPSLPVEQEPAITWSIMTKKAEPKEITSIVSPNGMPVEYKSVLQEA